MRGRAGLYRPAERGPKIMRFFVVCSADGGVKALPFRLDLKTGIASEVDARADLARPGAGELVKALSSGDATEAAEPLGGIVGVGDGHIRNSQVDVVQDVHKGNL